MPANDSQTREEYEERVRYWIGRVSHDVEAVSNLANDIDPRKATKETVADMQAALADRDDTLRKFVAALPRLLELRRQLDRSIEPALPAMVEIEPDEPPMAPIILSRRCPARAGLGALIVIAVIGAFATGLFFGLTLRILAE